MPRCANLTAVDFLESWLAELTKELVASIDAPAPPDVRAGQLDGILSQPLVRRMVLCDIFGAQGSVLEHNMATTGPKWFQLYANQDTDVTRSRRS